MQEVEPEALPEEQWSRQASEENGHHAAGAAASVWEALQERRSQLAEEHTLDLEVAGTFGMFGLRLGPVEGRAQARLTERYQKSKLPERDFNLNADVLIAACVAVLGRKDRELEWEPLEDEAGPYRLDQRLAEVFKLPQGASARDVLVRLYNGVPNPELAVTAAATEYLQWASGTGPDLDRELLGEA